MAELEKVKNALERCESYWPFHCYGKKDLEQMECPARNERLVLFDADE